MTQASREGERRLSWLVGLSLAGTLFTALVVLAGAWTRLVDAGLGCPDWPGCYGALVVPDAASALAHSPDTPLEAAKAWMEMLHRYLASSLGLLVVGVVLLGRPLRHRRGYPWRLSLALLAVVLLQGAFGAFTVTLKLWPQVVTLHLLGGLSVMVLFLWLHLRLHWVARRPAPPPPARRLPRLWWVALGLLVLQLALGGWTSSNYAGLACQGAPTCNGQWWPSADWQEGFNLGQTVGPSYLHGQLHAEARTAIHLAHRLGALLLGLCLVVVALRYRGEAALRPWLGLLVAVYGAQLGLGIVNVVLWLPLWLALLHTAGAVGLVTVATLTSWHWRTATVLASSPGTLVAEEWRHV